MNVLFAHRWHLKLIMGFIWSKQLQQDLWQCSSFNTCSSLIDRVSQHISFADALVAELQYSDYAQLYTAAV